MIFVILAILIISIVLHELAHGWTAYQLGDPTAKMAGRLTLNPLKHLHPVGSFLIPLLCYFMGGFIIGWARPVPVDIHKLKNGFRSMALVAAAGPATNFLIALIFALILREYFIDILKFSLILTKVLVLIILLNLFLTCLNLIPVFPLDGFYLLNLVLPIWLSEFLKKYGILILLILLVILFGGGLKVLLTMTIWITGILTGLTPSQITGIILT